MIVTLRIKKLYYDAIKSGEKTKEYRSVKPFYAALGSGEVTEVMLHYQGDRRLYCEVTKVRKIPAPQFLKESGIEFTPEVYEISLGKTKEVF